MYGINDVADGIIIVADCGSAVFAADCPQSGRKPGSVPVFVRCVCRNRIENVERALVIYGSDKLGTIYGLFTLSEYMGVSPMCYWGDADPIKKDMIYTQ